jgi:hypothetical protein
MLTESRQIPSRIEQTVGIDDEHVIPSGVPMVGGVGR